jgi:hypothetical protein
VGYLGSLYGGGLDPLGTGGVWASVSGDPGRQTYFGKSVGLGEPARSVTRLSLQASRLHTSCV